MATVGSVHCCAVPLLLLSTWIDGLSWKTRPQLFVLCVCSNLLVFWLPGKIGVQKGLTLGVLASAVFVTLSQTVWHLQPWSVLGWTGWILAVAAFVGYDTPSWSPL